MSRTSRIYTDTVYRFQCDACKKIISSANQFSAEQQMINHVTDHEYDCSKNGEYEELETIEVEDEPDCDDLSDDE